MGDPNGFYCLELGENRQLERIMRAGSYTTIVATLARMRH